jgi:hypothetical protein
VFEPVRVSRKSHGYKSSTTLVRAAPHMRESGESAPTITDTVRWACVATTIGRGSTMLDVAGGLGDGGVGVGAGAGVDVWGGCSGDGSAGLAAPHPEQTHPKAAMDAVRQAFTQKSRRLMAPIRRRCYRDDGRSAGKHPVTTGLIHPPAPRVIVLFKHALRTGGSWSSSLVCRSLHGSVFRGKAFASADFSDPS